MAKASKKVVPIVDVLTMDDYKKWIGKKVSKISKKPFKSTLKINTVKGVTTHSITKKPAFTFQEDDRIVECHRCEKI